MQIYYNATCDDSFNAETVLEYLKGTNGWIFSKVERIEDPKQNHEDVVTIGSVKFEDGSKVQCEIGNSWAAIYGEFEIDNLKWLWELDVRKTREGLFNRTLLCNSESGHNRFEAEL